MSDPSSFVALVLEGLHYASGLPWWFVVPATAFAVRAVTQPLLSRHRQRTQRLLAPLAPQLGAAMQRVVQGWASSSSRSARTAVLREWVLQRRAILSTCEAGHVSRNIYMYSYLPIVLVHVIGLRYAIAIDPSFATEGALWFPSLAAHDSWLRLSSAACIASLLLLGPLPGAGNPVRRLVHGAIALGMVSMLPIAHWVDMPEGIALHIVGVVAFRACWELYLKLRARLAWHSGAVVSDVSATMRSNNPKWK